MPQPMPTRVLVVHEEGSPEASPASWLREAGYTVIDIATAGEALAVVAAQKPDLIVLGLGFPDMNGLELCRMLKALPQAAGVPIILTSNLFIQSTVRAEGLKAGAAACLAEPEKEEIVAQVSCLLRVREVEAALRQSEERFRLATESMDGFVYEWHVSGGVTRRSIGMARFLGWRPEEVPIHSDWWPEQIHTEDARAAHRRFAKAVERGALDCQHEYRVRHKHGHYVWIRDSNRIVYDEHGKPVRVIGCAVSIDEHKRAEQELRDAKEALAGVNLDLEKKVQERTGGLLEMVAELESWSYSMAHDMRAPLRAMHSFSYFLLQDYGPRLDAVARDYLERINSAAHRLDMYLNDLLCYGKVARGALPLAAVDTKNLIGEILATYPQLQAHDCSVKVQSPMPAVHANASALITVVSHLLDNAVKFGKKDTPAEVRIWAEEKQPWVRLWFEDNGIGIEKEAQERVFGVFERLHPANDYEGTGIGLAIVRRSVERMGGNVGVESEPNHGSKFWVELRAA